MHRLYFFTISLSAFVASGPLAFSATTMETYDAPIGFALVEEDVSLNMKSIPLDLMDEAIVDFNKKNFGEATGDLKSASHFVRSIEGSKKNEKLARQAMLSADNLDLIAKDIRNSKIRSVKSLKERLGQVAYYQSIARRSEATQEWKRRQLKQAGYDLDAAATALERSIEWTGKGQSSDNAAMVSSSHAVAAKIIGGSGWKEEEVKLALSNLSTVTAAVGAKVLPEGYKAAEQPSEF